MYILGQMAHLTERSKGDIFCHEEALQMLLIISENSSVH